MFENSQHTIESTTLENDAYDHQNISKSLQLSTNFISCPKEKKQNWEFNSEKVERNDIQMNDEGRNVIDTVKDTQVLEENLVFNQKKKNVHRIYRKRKSQNLQCILQPYFDHSILKRQRKGLGQFREYIHRRNQSYYGDICSQQKIDLGVYTLKEIVWFCVQKKLISNELLIDFGFQNLQRNEEQFVQKLNNGNILEVDFEDTYFTPLDHRILTTVLVQHFPDEFKQAKQPLMQSSLLTDFYGFLYEIEADSYLEILRQLNYKFNRSWMPNNLEEFYSIVEQKMHKRPRIFDEESFPFYKPARKMRKKY